MLSEESFLTADDSLFFDDSLLIDASFLTEDSFLRKVEIKFDSKARTEADRARLDFLEDILKTIVEWIKNKSKYIFLETQNNYRIL